MGGGRGAGGDKRMEGFAAAIEGLSVLSRPAGMVASDEGNNGDVLMEERMPKVEFWKRLLAILAVLQKWLVILAGN